jgi:hypothetical protein
MSVQIEFVWNEHEEKRHPTTISLSRVPCVNERVYAAFLDDVTWTVTDVVHRDVEVEKIAARVTLRRS